MVQILNILWFAVEACVDWTNKLFEATDAMGIVVAVFIIVLCVSLFLMPIRGIGFHGGSVVRDMTKQAVHKGFKKKGSVR